MTRAPGEVLFDAPDVGSEIEDFDVEAVLPHHEKDHQSTVRQYAGRKRGRGLT